MSIHQSYILVTTIIRFIVHVSIFFFLTIYKLIPLSHSQNRNLIIRKFHFEKANTLEKLLGRIYTKKTYYKEYLKRLIKNYK